MTLSSLQSRIVGIFCLIPLGSCSLVSQSGPNKSRINQTTPDFSLIEVKSLEEIPARARNYGLAQAPPPLRGEAYSDKIRPRDSLSFHLTDLAEESPFFSRDRMYEFGPVEIPDAGRVSIPYVGEIQVIGLTLAEVAADLGERIKPVSATARVSVIRVGRVPKTANVIGEVNKPGPIPLERAGITSIDALAYSGGTTKEEHLFTYTLRRNGRDYPFDYVGFRQNAFPLEEGDLLNVSADSANRFHVMGAINRPTTLVFPIPEPSLADALGAAAGLDERRADPSGVFVFRAGDTNQIFTFNLNDPGIIHLIQRFPIQGDDLVYVTEAPLARWNRTISQFLPVAVSQAANSASRYQN
jgi:polysaccharide export outer membrane protein